MNEVSVHEEVMVVMQSKFPDYDVMAYNDDLVLMGCDEGLICFDRCTCYWETYNDFNSLLPEIINSLHYDEEHGFWIGTSVGLYLYDGESFSLFDKIEGFELTQQPISIISTIIPANDGNGLWLLNFYQMGFFNTKKMDWEILSSPESDFYGFVIHVTGGKQQEYIDSH